MIHTHDPAEGVRVFTFDRPERRNAFDPPQRARLRRLVEIASADEAVRVVVLAGGPTVFSSGVDLKALNMPGGSVNTGSVEMWQAINACAKPLIAAVEGPAVGLGCELALACDMIVAGQGASFRLAELARGLVPGAGGTQRLVRAVGKFRAMRMVLSAQPISAEEAESWGLLSQRVAAGEALAVALSLAETIAALPPDAIAAAKRLLLTGPDMPLPDALAAERAVLLTLLDSPERYRRAAAFLAGDIE